MKEKTNWTINRTPDDKLTPEQINQYEHDLLAFNPVTPLEYSQVLELEQDVISYWFKNPYPLKKSKYCKRKKLFSLHYMIWSQVQKQAS